MTSNLTSPSRNVVALGGLLSSRASAPISPSPGRSRAGQQPGSDPRQSDAIWAAGSAVPQANPSTYNSCALLPATKQSLCPVQRVKVISAPELRSFLDPKGRTSSSAGAVVYALAAPGLTSQWLAHLIECYQARTIEAGNAMPERESGPLAEPDSTYSVSRLGRASRCRFARRTAMRRGGSSR